MALRKVGLLVFSQGFSLSRDEYIIRELAFCDWTGHDHVLFKYLLPAGVLYKQLFETAQTRVDRQTKTVHGLPFEPFLSDHNRQDFHAYHQTRDHIHRWCQRYLNRGLYPQWHVSPVTRTPVFVNRRGLGRAGLPRLAQFTYRHRQCHGPQRSWPQLVHGS